jgi:hypothetical protein
MILATPAPPVKPCRTATLYPEPLRGAGCPVFVSPQEASNGLDNLEWLPDKRIDSDGLSPRVG